MEENMNLKIKFYNNHFTKKIDNKKGMNIYNQNGQEYLIVERDYIYDLKLSDSLKDDSVILEECKKMKIHACGISVAIDGMKTLGIKGKVVNMSREDVLKKVINIYSDIVEENTGERPIVEENTVISREDGFDSLGIVDFFVAVEEECGVDLEDSIVQIREASVIENLVDIIYGRILG